MPTPFQHLVYAHEVLDHALLPEQIRQRIYPSLGAYLLGSTAVDVQSITGQPRSATHFYHIHGESTARAGETLLTTHPHLADPERLPPAHAAFISGYLVHLAGDECWLRDVFRPFYMESTLWPDRLTRNIHHNALRVLVDRQAEATLRTCPAVIPLLCAVQPDQWLPFVDNEALCRWRDGLVAQLADPAAVQTVQVFAERMGVSPAHLEAAIRAIAEDTYTPPVPGLRAAITAFESHSLAESIETLKKYWRWGD
ncbi:MAG TPA: hypothetical protein PLH19_05850 [Anaerolineae bacterium]|nr:hypothetical protein [Anaerolineae bacterium]HQH38044.1 hypothetical protein [Anaerolineae bacterium]